jgi:GntR family transcriptional repressor for pyruvate dehydrogenase complex
MGTGAIPDESAGFRPVRELRGDVKLSDRIVSDFEDRIVYGELAPGERLPTESELCELLGVSRSVVRDAVRTLVARGLVEVRQGRGMIVAAPDDHAYSVALTLLLARSTLSMSDVLDARTTLETALGMLTVSSATEADIARLQSQLDALRLAVEAKDWQLASDSHLGFHSALLRALHLPALDKLLEPMQQLIVFSSMPPQNSDDLWDLEAHVPIVDALVAKDPDAMRVALARHYQRSRAPGSEEWLAMPFRKATAIGREQLKQRLLKQQIP